LWLKVCQLLGQANAKEQLQPCRVLCNAFGHRRSNYNLLHALLSWYSSERTNQLFGDNLGVIQNASIPEATLQKKHAAILFHRVRECVAAKIIDNFTDISSPRSQSMVPPSSTM